mmetsp:Transcript_24136/g.68008  ORF Transcript_24136/g.68008 Transcript_24136/m.68008 type:complete len:84 (+) Transcript_24136:1-252(+)
MAETDYYVMGQVCVAKEHRGSGIFSAMYQHHKQLFSGKFKYCLTAISTSNPRSLQAHKKVGFRTIETYDDSVDAWNTVAWNWE